MILRSLHLTPGSYSGTIIRVYRMKRAESSPEGLLVSGDGGSYIPFPYPNPRSTTCLEATDHRSRLSLCIHRHSFPLLFYHPRCAWYATLCRTGCPSKARRSYRRYVLYPTSCAQLLTLLLRGWLARRPFVHEKWVLADSKLSGRRCTLLTFRRGS